MAPSAAPAPMGARPDRPPAAGQAPAGPRAGYRWIAVRPGPPPPPRRPRRPLGPTPRYASIPRWGLLDPIAVPAPAEQHTVRRAASPAVVRATLLAAGAVFALAAAAHVVRYLLLLVNRTTLLPPLVANGALLIGVLASLAALAAVVATAAVSTSWLIGRRAAAFARQGVPDPRPEWALWAGCLVPLVNLVWAPVFVIELAAAEQARDRLRAPIITWWLAWVFATGVCGWAMWTSGATEPQAVADNTVTVIVAYLAGWAVLILLWRVFDEFVRRPVERPLHRWVVVRDTAAAADDPADTAEEFDDSTEIIEIPDREPAA